MKSLNTERRALILNCLSEGMSLRSTARITRTALNTVLSLLVKAGEACSIYMDEHMVNLPCRNIQLDELWGFVFCREKNKGERKNCGDIWTWTALCRDTKLLPVWRIGDRSARTANDFCSDLAIRFAGPVQISSDGLAAYRSAIGLYLPEAKFAQLVKVYTQDERGYDFVERVEHHSIQNNPDLRATCTSHIERSNYTVRMINRRYTRRSSAFSKKMENHCHAFALSAMAYNYCKKHRSLGATPAQAAGLEDRQWSMEQVVEMMDQYHERKVLAQFESAFALRYTPERAHPKSYPPTPKDQIPVPWYLNPNGEIPENLE